MSDALLTQLLARRREISHEVVDVDEPSHQLVLVRMGEQLYALAGQSIREILAQPEVCWVPGCPSSMEGVINLRGTIESVIRLHDLLQCGESSSSSNSFVLIAETASLRTGIRVEGLLDMIEVSESALQAPPTSLPASLQPYVRHLLTYQQHPIAVLNLERLLADYAQRLV